MIGSSRVTRVFACRRPVDMRRWFDGLFGIATGEMGHDVLAGDLFLFVGKDRKRAKVLYWDGTGLCVFAKRLEKGRFASLWRDEGNAQLTLTQTELSLFLEGSTLVGKVALSPPPFVLGTPATSPPPSR